MKNRKYNSDEADVMVKVSSRRDKFGNVFFCCEYGDNEYVTFEKMSSVIDFVKSNF